MLLIGYLSPIVLSGWTGIEPAILASLRSGLSNIRGREAAFAG